MSNITMLSVDRRFRYYSEFFMPGSLLGLQLMLLLLLLYCCSRC